MSSDTAPTLAQLQRRATHARNAAGAAEKLGIHAEYWADKARLAQTRYEIARDRYRAQLRKAAR